jgi:hypothetical protein
MAQRAEHAAQNLVFKSIVDNRPVLVIADVAQNKAAAHAMRHAAEGWRSSPRAFIAQYQCRPPPRRALFGVVRLFSLTIR